MIHTISPTRQTVHGFFSADLPPIATVSSGDTVVFSTLDAGWHRDPDVSTGGWDHDEHVEWYDPDRDTGHPLVGPIAVNGAEPGMTLVVEVVDLRPGTWGWSVGGGWNSPVNDALGVGVGETFGIQWMIDADGGIARDRRNKYVVRTRPFLGVMGMCPDEAGKHPTAPPRRCGGNIDCKELVKGTRLWLPIDRMSAMFSAGDGHALQADGEVSGVAIECPMERVELKLELVADDRLAMPRAWTPEAWITLGFHEDLDVAANLALAGMLDLMEEELGFGRREALALASLVVDLRVTQIVNGVRGAHAVLEHGRLQELDL